MLSLRILIWLIDYDFGSCELILLRVGQNDWRRFLLISMNDRGGH